EQAVALGEDDNQVWGGLQELLIGVGAQRSQGLEPLRRGAVGVEFLLFSFCCFPNAALDCWVGDGYEKPRLPVGAARRGAGGAQAVFDALARPLPVSEVTHGAAALEVVMEGGGAAGHLRSGILAIGRQRDQLRWHHKFLPFSALYPTFDGVAMSSAPT